MSGPFTTYSSVESASSRCRASVPESEPAIALPCRPATSSCENRICRSACFASAVSAPGQTLLRNIQRHLAVHIAGMGKHRKEQSAETASQLRAPHGCADEPSKVFPSNAVIVHLSPPCSPPAPSWSIAKTQNPAEPDRLEKKLSRACRVVSDAASIVRSRGKAARTGSP